MKRLLVIILAIFFYAGLNNSVHAQKPLTKLDREYGSSQFDNAREVIPTPDGGFVLAGNSKGFSADGTSDFYLVKLDASGTTQWEQTADGDNATVVNYETGPLTTPSSAARSNQLGYWGNQLQLTNDGGYMMAGTSAYSILQDPPQDFRGYPLVVKFDASGNVVWSKEYRGNYPIKNLESIEKINGGYVLAGRSTEGGNSAIYLKIDENGNVLWESIQHVLGFAYAIDVVEMDNGNILGYAYSIGSGTGFRSYLLELNGSTGALVNQHDMNALGYNFWVTDIEKTSDGFALVGGNWSPYDKPAAAKLDASAQLEWFHIYQDSVIYSSRPYAVTEDSEGNFIASGYVNQTANDKIGLFSFSADDGSLNWFHQYTTGGVEFGSSIAIAQDGDYVLSSVNESNLNSTNMRFIKSGSVDVPGYITGRVVVDDDQNCQLSTGDPGVANQMVQAVGSNGVYQTLTDNQGNYSLTVDRGDYLVSMAPQPNGGLFIPSTTCTASPYATTVVRSQTSPDNDFIVQYAAMPGDPSCAVTVSSEYGEDGPCPGGGSLITPCPGFRYTYCVLYTNMQQDSIDLGQMEMNIQIPDFVVGSIDITSIDDLTPTITINDFQPPGSTDITIQSGTVIPIGGSFEYCISFIIEPSFTGPYQVSADGFNYNLAAPEDVCIPVTTHDVDDQCSCDPNDMQVYPMGCGPEGNVRTDEHLAYKVRFENIGTGNAHDIVVRNTLDSDLDVSTIRLVESSHTVTSFRILPGNELEVVFEDVELPGIQSALNKGYFIYMIEPLANSLDGTVIENGAAIYFDQNEPVITNTVVNTLYANPSVEADFTYVKSCTSSGNEFDFNYSGGTSGATFAWNFGPNASPSASSEMNLLGVSFPSGTHTVSLTVSKNGCSETIEMDVESINVVNIGNRVLVCHNGQTLSLPAPAAAAHLQHGDCLGACTGKSAVIPAEIFGDVLLYPNPTKSVINLQSETPIIGEVVVMGVDGRIISIHDGSDLQLLSINVESLSRGSYIVQMETKDGLQLIKFFRE